MGGTEMAVATAAVETGSVMIYAAATESIMVIDMSYSYMLPISFYLKGGASLVIDFSDDGGIYSYAHGGIGFGCSNGVSYYQYNKKI